MLRAYNRFPETASRHSHEFGEGFLFGIPTTTSLYRLAITLDFSHTDLERVEMVGVAIAEHHCVLSSGSDIKAP